MTEPPTSPSGSAHTQPVLGPPPQWLPGLVRALEPALRDAPIEGVAGGAGWLSLRVAGRYLWLVALPWLRAAWLDVQPAPAAWLSALGRHRETPFAAHLRARALRGAALLQSPSAAPHGLVMAVSGEPPLQLYASFWPRPGSLWLETARNAADEGDRLGARTPLARTGARPNQDATAAAAGTVPTAAETPPLDLVVHAQRARAALEAGLHASVARRLRGVLQATLKREQRRVAAQRHDVELGEAAARLRAQADLLAAHLHEVRRGRATVTLTSFDGTPMTIALDPARSPADNLNEKYRLAGRGERKLIAAQARLTSAVAAVARAQEGLELLAQPGDLEMLIALAVELGVDPAPVRGGTARQRQPPPPRLPYKTFILASGREVRVGKSARDNDELTRDHSAPTDLWLHASGVEGSHVVLRTDGKPVSARDREQAAQLAALYSKARTAQTVPVIVTLRKHVRKPRGAPPGRVAAERAKTLFVTPALPPGSTALTTDSADRAGAPPGRSG